MNGWGRMLLAVTVLLLSACGIGSDTVAISVDAESTISSRVNSTLTAEAYQGAAFRVTQTVEAGIELATAIAQPSIASETSGSSGDAVTPVPDGTSVMPVIDLFQCNPCTIDPGGAAVLNWDVEGAITLTLDGRGVASPGSLVVRPDQTTKYRLLAANEAGRSEKTMTVQVDGVPLVHYFSCIPCEVMKGETATLSWDLSGGTAAYLDGEGVPAPGNVIVAPNKTTSYRLEAVGETGSVERLVTVTVKEGGDPETVEETLSARGYQVRWVGNQPLSTGGQAIGVIMSSPVASQQNTEEYRLEQYYWGFKTLYDNFPGEETVVGLHDGTRYVSYAVARPNDIEDLLRGELGLSEFWADAGWWVWDEWTGQWSSQPSLDFGQKDFVNMHFGR